MRLADPADKRVAVLRYGYERAKLRASGSGLAHVAQGGSVTVASHDASSDKATRRQLREATVTRQL